MKRSEGLRPVRVLPVTAALAVALCGAPALAQTAEPPHPAPAPVAPAPAHAEPAPAAAPVAETVHAEPATQHEPAHEGAAHEEPAHHGGPEAAHEGGPEGGHEEEHEAPEPRLIVGVTGAMAAQFPSEGENGVHFGAGARLAWVAVPERLEVEVGMHAIFTSEATELPVDLLLKSVFPVNHWLHPYMGVGATLVPAIGHDATHIGAGAVVSAGTYFWFTHRVGALAELNYNLVRIDNTTVHEAFVAVGVVFGFLER